MLSGIVGIEFTSSLFGGWKMSCLGASNQEKQKQPNGTKYDRCDVSVPNESFKRLLDLIKATNVKTLIIKDGTTEDGRPLIAEQV